MIGKARLFVCADCGAVADSAGVILAAGIYFGRKCRGALHRWKRPGEGLGKIAATAWAAFDKASAASSQSTNKGGGGR